ncbi:hypothetical protein DFH07DRAFT_480327 [Mycena maculata]|uniref:Uncharacterized protein n=1 Tax=Mycena maculata TaxID=230809 RepID=A0AAD7J3R4_9AGAR|nr:hypothetical protein DFH07DRAFT_480327 [Mycena maculata]
MFARDGEPDRRHLGPALLNEVRYNFAVVQESMSLSLLGSLWRTSLRNPVYILRATHISPYRPLARDRILKSLLTSPRNGPLAAEQLEPLDSDPAKDPWACIIGRPGEGRTPVTEFGMPHLPGPSWADDGEHDALGKWDVVCRVATLANLRKDPDTSAEKIIQWGEYSSEILSAVACAAVSSASTADPVIPPSQVSKLVENALEASTDESSLHPPVSIPVRILLTHSERVVVVHVPVYPSTMAVHFPLETSYDRYRRKFNDSEPGIPRVAVEHEIPFEQINQLPTGRVLDTIDLPRHHPVDLSIIQPLNGYVAILVDHSTLDIREGHDALAMLLPEEIEKSYPQLASILLDIRERVLSVFPTLRNTTSMPAICLVGQMENSGYDTVDGNYLCSCQANLSARSLSESGQWEETLANPILLALAVAQGLKGSVPYEKRIQTQVNSCGVRGADRVDELLGGEVVVLDAAHPSGVLAATAKFYETNKGRRASSVRLQKTAFEIMRGEFFFPRTIIEVDEQYETEYYTLDSSDIPS